MRVDEFSIAIVKSIDDFASRANISI